jgi:hypothetical protein
VLVGVMTTTDTVRRSDVFWLPNGCPQWCTDGHKAEDHPDDRSHMSEEVYVDLTLEPADHGEVSTTEMYLYEHVTDAEASIRFGAGACGRELNLTLAEARGLAATLLALCEEAS